MNSSVGLWIVMIFIFAAIFTVGMIVGIHVGEEKHRRIDVANYQAQWKADKDTGKPIFAYVYCYCGECEERRGR